MTSSTSSDSSMLNECFGGTMNQSNASTAAVVVSSEDTSGSQIAASADASTSVIAACARPMWRSSPSISSQAAAQTRPAQAHGQRAMRRGEFGSSSVIGATVPDRAASRSARPARRRCAGQESADASMPGNGITASRSGP